MAAAMQMLAMVAYCDDRIRFGRAFVLLICSPWVLLALAMLTLLF